MSVLKTAPAGAAVFDLGAARVARAETQNGEPKPLIKLAVGYVEVNPEFDVLAAEKFAVGQIRAGLSMMLADPADVDVLIAEGLSKNDLDAIGKFISGANLGEFSASSTP